MYRMRCVRHREEVDVHPAEGAGHLVQRLRGARQPHERYQQVHVELVRVPQGRKLGHQRVVRTPEPIGDLFRRQPGRGRAWQAAGRRPMFGVPSFMPNSPFRLRDSGGMPG